MRTPVMPEVGTRAVCSRCGKTVWLRHVGTTGVRSMPLASAPIYQWVGRKGSKPRPLHCAASDGWPTTFHTVEGHLERYYGEPDPT